MMESSLGGHVHDTFSDLATQFVLMLIRMKNIYRISNLLCRMVRKAGIMSVPIPHSAVQINPKL